MSRLRVSALTLFVAVLSLAQTASQLTTPGIRRVGERLACLCGACKNTVANCPMLECHYAKPAKEKIAQMQSIGATDENVIARFIKDDGLKALSSPPAEGFNLLSWVMPFVALLAGLGAVFAWIRHYRKPAPAMAELPPELLDQYRSRAEKETAGFDE
ncbi:MAG: cytochrome c-type biogenesis protein CcmH [Acidobacteria bacterium]|nr:cytochrome c-type biogenesis protein CcmH [Acidobacteriota bacterium]